ncbi:type II secretion protein F, partial [Paraburkholderia sp. SIMBA_009]
MLQAGVIAGLALVLALAAVLLWRHANSGQRRAASSAFLEDQLRRGRGAPVSGKMPFAHGARALRSGFSRWDMLLLQGGVRQSPGFYAKLTLPIVLAALLAWAFLGWLSGLVTLVLLTVFAYFLLWLRADRRQRRRVAQLPAFLDNIVRLVTIG